MAPEKTAAAVRMEGSNSLNFGVVHAANVSKTVSNHHETAVDMTTKA